MGIDFNIDTNKEQLEHALEAIQKLRLKKPVRVNKPDNTSPKVLKNSVVAYVGSEHKSEFSWVCFKCSQDTEEVDNPYFVSQKIHNYGVF
jgi:hypothetical protein